MVNDCEYRGSISGVPPNGWFIRKNTMNMDDEQGYPHFRKPPYEGKAIECGAPVKEIAKLVNKTPITMVCCTCSYSINRVYKPTYILGVPHCRGP